MEVEDTKNLERKVAPVNKFSAVETTRAGTIGGVEEKMSSSILLLFVMVRGIGRLEREVILSLR